VISREPLSAQAQTPRRPSGADKKQKPAKKQGGRGRSRQRRGSLGRSTPNSQHLAANQHCQTLLDAQISAETIDGSLPGPRSGAVLDENYGRPQCQKRVRKRDLTMLVVVRLDRTTQYSSGRGEPKGCSVREFPAFAGNDNPVERSEAVASTAVRDEPTAGFPPPLRGRVRERGATRRALSE
jgi:hypothetical protein